MKLNIKDKILFGIIMVLMLLLFLGNCKNSKITKQLYEEKIKTNKAIVESDVLKKEKDGQYAKLVNNFNDQKDMVNILKNQNKDLYKEIKSNNEKLLMVNNSVISLASKMSEGFGSINKVDTNLIDLKLRYPNSDDWFIDWSGNINRKTARYEGKWSFGDLPLDIILTETDRGIWNSRIVGPSWLIVNKMEINALKPSDMIPDDLKERKFGLILGGGYNKSFDNMIPNSLSIGVGGYVNKHSIIFNGTTNKSLGFNYYYRFTTFKK
jgi:uncharacterized membrane-anchored protein YhcB (DUF1043 family)